jgi:hypothetical protein
LLPNQQCTLPKEGFPTFIRSACIAKFNQSGKGSLISYGQLNSSRNASERKIAMVKAIWYNLGGVDTIELWELLDVVDKDGVPLILKCNRWDSMLPLLQLRFFLFG